MTAAAAAHWFDLPAFYQAAREALCPGGVIALWSYDLMHVTPAVDRVVRQLYRDIVGEYWPPERVLVETCYRTIDLPFEEIEAPPLEMEHAWDLAALTGYLRSWSAAQRYQGIRGEDPLVHVAEALAEAWGDPAVVRPVRFPLFMRVGRTART